jgi:hypothetical protein
MVINFPDQRPKALRSLVNSALARPCGRLELHLDVRGQLAEYVFVAAGRQGLEPAVYVIRALGILHDGGSL